VHVSKIDEAQTAISAAKDSLDQAVTTIEAAAQQAEEAGEVLEAAGAEANAQFLVQCKETIDRVA
jgi:DNA-binding ferritin-like protein